MLYLHTMADSGAGCAVSGYTVQFAGEPNPKYGPAGDVLPGRLMTYTVTFENEGQGIAYGVYIEDALSEFLDESTLKVYGTGVFITPTRTLIWMVREVAPKGSASSTGAVSLTVRLKDGLPGGTVVMNQAVVYLPSVPERTPTNPVVNLVRPITALPQTEHTGAMTSVTIRLEWLDVGASPLTYAISLPPLSAFPTGAGSLLTCTPGANFAGEDPFSFKVGNAATESRRAEARVIVDLSAADTIPPQVMWSHPESGATGVAVGFSPVSSDDVRLGYRLVVSIQFSEVISETTITTDTVRLSDIMGYLITAAVGYDGTTHEGIAAPRQILRYSAVYTVTILPCIRDASGSPVASTCEWHFANAESPLAVRLPLVSRNH